MHKIGVLFERKFRAFVLCFVKSFIEVLCTICVDLLSHLCLPRVVWGVPHIDSTQHCPILVFVGTIKTNWRSIKLYIITIAPLASHIDHHNGRRDS